MSSNLISISKVPNMLQSNVKCLVLYENSFSQSTPLPLLLFLPPLSFHWKAGLSSNLIYISKVPKHTSKKTQQILGFIWNSTWSINTTSYTPLLNPPHPPPPHTHFWLSPILSLALSFTKKTNLPKSPTWLFFFFLSVVSIYIYIHRLFFDALGH